MVYKIAITGPESTGKSVLAKQLAEYYNTAWVPEHARVYINELNRHYDRGDILLIAKEQLRNENELIKKAKKFLFCDTELIVTKIWSEDKFGSCDEWILNRITRNRYDLYLLCDIDMPWEYDPQREDPDRREYFFDLYKRELDQRAFPYFVISGTGKMRLLNAVNNIEAFFRL